MGLLQPPFYDGRRPAYESIKLKYRQTFIQCIYQIDI